MKKRENKKLFAKVSNGFIVKNNEVMPLLYINKVINMAENPFEHSHYYKYYSVYPIVKGPHHKEDCLRYQSTMALNTKLAHNYKSFGVVAFVAEPHNKRG